ncbi:hypothetical protein BH11GEM1_BH11GEM1_06330 [soil metagenome]
MKVNNSFTEPRVLAANIPFAARDQAPKCRTAPPTQCAGGAVRDASAALLGRPSQAQKLPANNAESVGKEEGRRALHGFQYIVCAPFVK